MEIMKIKDEKQFRDTLTASINLLKPKLEEIFGLGNPAVKETVNYIFNKAVAVHDERRKKREQKK